MNRNPIPPEDKRREMTGEMPSLNAPGGDRYPGFGPLDMPEEMRAIMPNFPHIRDVYYRMDVFFAVAMLIIQLIAFGLLYITDGLGRPAGEYLFWQILFPTVLNVIILFAAYLFNRFMSDQNIAKFTIPIFAMGAMGTVICMTYCTHVVVTAVLCVPVCMTAVFTDMSNSKVTLCGALSILASTARHILIVETHPARVRSAVEGLIALSVLILVHWVIYTTLQMMGGQKNKMIVFFRSTKAAQSQAEAARVQAEAANQAKSAFLANMSLEIRTPINAILGMNEMILRESTNEQITEYAGSIRSASTALLYLVNDVLDFSQIESGKLEITEMDYDTASFIHDCYSMISDRAEKKGLAMKVDCDPQLPVTLRGDEIRCRQVVTNLLSNAYKYTETGSIRMTVGGHRENDSLLMEIAVTDTGIGIREENIKKLFSKFVRFDLVKNRSIEGTGLGLTITKQLVEMMGGRIDVESEYGKGSTFTVVIPQKIVDGAPVGDFNKRYRDINVKNETYQQSFEAPDVRILVVDDVEVNLKVIVNLLKKTKIKVDTALSGFQCLEMVAECSYDMIFLDHMMPEMNGIETYARLRAMPDNPNNGIPVVMLTANAITGVREQYLSEGFSDYLSKPINSDKLEQMILKYLPADKVHPVSGQVKASTINVRCLTYLQNMFQAYPGIDMEKGMAGFGGDAAAYAGRLEEFAADAGFAELDTALEGQDKETYAAVLRRIGKTAGELGLTALSQRAQESERMFDIGGWNGMGDSHQAMSEEYRLLAAADGASRPEKN